MRLIHKFMYLYNKGGSIFTLFAAWDCAFPRPLMEYGKWRTVNILGRRKTRLENSVRGSMKYLCKIQLQLLPVEV